MRLLNEKTKSAILEAGKKEFLEYGFEKASLRRIAAIAQVTTGAIYTYFPDKGALFEALVKEPAEELKGHFLKATKTMDETLSEDISSWRKWLDVDPRSLVDFLYQHFEAFHLLCCKASGTSYEGYMNGLAEMETAATTHLIKHLQQSKVLKRELEEELIHIITSTYYAGIFEPIAHEMPKEKALQYVEVLGEFYTAGWQKILGF
ncbi:AcrR family transcriptional regulator [Lachnospiraceae bacterium PF1-21]